MLYKISDNAQFSCLLSRSGSINCPFAHLWGQPHSVIARTELKSPAEALLKRDWKCLFIPHMVVWGKVEEGEEKKPCNKCKFQLYSVISCILLLCNNSVIGDKHPTRLFLNGSQLLLDFPVCHFSGDNFTLKLFNQNSDSLLMSW